MAVCSYVCSQHTCISHHIISYRKEKKSDKAESCYEVSETLPYYNLAWLVVLCPVDVVCAHCMYPWASDEHIAVCVMSWLIGGRCNWIWVSGGFTIEASDSFCYFWFLVTFTTMEDIHVWCSTYQMCSVTNLHWWIERDFSCKWQIQGSHQLEAQAWSTNKTTYKSSLSKMGRSSGMAIDADVFQREDNDEDECWDQICKSWTSMYNVLV